MINLLMALHANSKLVLFLATVTEITNGFHGKVEQRPTGINLYQEPIQDHVYVKKRHYETKLSTLDPFSFPLPFATIVRRASKRSNQDVEEGPNIPFPPIALHILDMAEYTKLLLFINARNKMKIIQQSTPETSKTPEDLTKH